ncbi:MAG TPA: alpha/beta fold hydrolase [Steroidobacteraceae bacterium]|nr:alpha/beta fold hydrolase [Steroidobacteraceae bacterium]
MSFSPPPAQPLRIAGPAGELEALREEPPEVAGAGIAVLCHPHPQHGGTMQNKVVHTLARACHELGMATLRFNYRGVGSSDGSYDGGRGETDDVRAVVARARALWPERELTLAGFSFGAMVALQAAPATHPARMISVAPAVTRGEFGAIARPAADWLVLMGDADEVVDPAAVRRWVAAFPDPPAFVNLPGAGHFFHGRLTELKALVQDWLKRPGHLSQE